MCRAAGSQRGKMEEEGMRCRQMCVAQHAGNDAKKSWSLDLFNNDHLDRASII